MSHLVTFGEATLRLCPPGPHRLEAADELEVHVNGASSNAAVAAGRFGVEATWISKVPDSPLGRRIVAELEGHGVDARVVWAPEGRTGVVYHEAGDGPREPISVQDRANTAFATAEPEELPIEPLRSADLFLATGATPALSRSVGTTLGSLLVTARERGITTALALDHRPELWDAETAREVLGRYFPAVDLLITSAADARTVLGVDGPATDLVHHIASTWEFETVVVTLGGHGAIAWHESTVVEREPFRTEPVDPAGAADAFVGTFLARRLEGDDVHNALGMASATAALAETVPGNLALVTPEEASHLLAEIEGE